MLSAGLDEGELLDGVTNWVGAAVGDAGTSGEVCEGAALAGPGRVSAGTTTTAAVGLGGVICVAALVATGERADVDELDEVTRSGAATTTSP